MLQEYVDSGMAVHVVFTVIAIEAVAVWIYKQRTGRGLTSKEIFWFLASGVMLLAALQVAIVEGPAWLIIAFLAAAGVSHALDLAVRVRRQDNCDN